MKSIWYDPVHEDGAAFRTGRACWVSTSVDRSYHERIAEFPISVSTYYGLFGLGVVDRLEHLPTESLPLGAYEEAVLLPAGLAEAARILRTTAEGLPPETLDFKAASQTEPESLEYWVKVDSAELKIALLDLAAFVEAGARQGYAIQFWL